MVAGEVEDVPVASELFFEKGEERVIDDEADVSEESEIKGCLFEGEGCLG